MFYFVYVLQDEDSKSLYIGFSSRLKERITEHLTGKGSFTSKCKNWSLIYFEGYRNKKDTLGREKFLKGGSGRKYLLKQLENFYE